MNEEIEAAAAFLHELEKTLSVDAAYWLRQYEDSPWYLYVATDRAHPEKIGDGNREVLRVAEELNDPHFDPFRVKLVQPSDPIARDVIDLLRRYRSPKPIHYRDRALGHGFIEEIYIYPSPVPAPA